MPISTTHLIILPCVGHDSTEEDSSRKIGGVCLVKSFELIFDDFMIFDEFDFHFLISPIFA